MTNHQLLDMIGDARGEFLLEAQQHRETKVLRKKKKTGYSVMYRIAAVITVVLAGILFLQTPIGAAAVELVKESVSRWIETLFPPRDIIVMPEGAMEVVPHEAQGRDPVEEVPGFVMYVDMESYEMTEENGIYYIRQIPIEYDREEIRKQQAAVLEGLTLEEQEKAIDQRIQELEDFYGSLPVKEIEIREISDKDYLSYAEEIHSQMVQNWDVVTDMSWTDRPLAFTFTAADGIGAHDPYENHYFVDNGKQGTFHIISRYYQEVAEGHGSRFAAMIQTFRVVTEKDAAEKEMEEVESQAPWMESSPEEVVSQFMEAYFGGDGEKISQYLSESYQGDQEVYTDTGNQAPVIHAIKGLDDVARDMAEWGAVYPSVEFRITPDSDYYIYLSMELVWEDNQWKVSFYGLEG